MEKYTVKTGDTLGKIANKFYKDPSKYMLIANYNNIKDPNLIRVGQILVIPEIKTETPIIAVKPANTENNNYLSLESLKKIMPNATEANCRKFIEPLNKAMVKYKINTDLRQCHFIAQLAHESGSFRYTEELASGEAYENRKDLGNTSPGDGKKFKGRGLIQLTGRSNYQKYGEYIGVDLTLNPEQVATDPILGVDVAGWFWTIRKLNLLADKDDLKAITKKINGGYNGLADREKYYNLASANLLKKTA